MSSFENTSLYLFIEKDMLAALQFYNLLSKFESLCQELKKILHSEPVSLFTDTGGDKDADPRSLAPAAGI